MLLREGGEGEAADAEAAAARLSMPFHLFCWQAEFQECVIDPFTRGSDGDHVHFLDTHIQNAVGILKLLLLYAAAVAAASASA